MKRKDIPSIITKVQPARAGRTNHNGSVFMVEDYVSERNIPVSEVMHRPNDIISLTHIKAITWTALRDMGVFIDELKKISEYKAPFVDWNTYFAIYPIFINTKDSSIYKDRLLKSPDFRWTDFHEIAFSGRFLRDMFGPESIAKQAIVTHIMGPGYNSYCSYDDGFSSLSWGAVDLENGDKLLCRYFEWFNK